MSRRRRSEHPNPENGHTLIVGVVARISGCQNQKELSLEDQVDHAKEGVAELYDGPIEYRVIATKGKGKRLDRPELAEVEAMLRSRELDLLVMDDVGRFVRGTAAKDLWGVAVDHGTRCIAPNDCLDTADANWEEDTIAACRDHVAHNAHTSKRIKQKQMNRFRRRGEATAAPIFGVVKPDGAKSYDEWHVDDRMYGEKTAVEWIREGKALLSRTLDCSAVADFFNKSDVPTGPCAKGNKWTGRLVRGLYSNTILKGMPYRDKRMTVKHHETGRRIPVDNPDGPSFYEVPHLAIINADEFDEHEHRLREKNARLGRRESGGPFTRGPRTRTRFPGQHAVCWYCGRQLVWGANGKKDALMCNGSREHRCWNSIGVPGGLLAGRIVDRILLRLDALDGFDDQWADLVRSTYEDRVDVGRERSQLSADRDRLESFRKNLVDAIAEYGIRDEFADRLEELDERERDLERRERLLERRAAEEPGLPGSVAELREEFDESLHRLAIDSWQMGLLRQLVPSIHVYTVRLCDGTGHPLPRARVVVDLAAGMEELAANSEL